MAAKLYKRIMVCTGEVTGNDGQRTFKRQREIGIVIKHEVRGSEWLDLRLHADILNPVLFQQLKAYAIPQGDSMFIATLADVPRQMTVPGAGEEKAEEGPVEGGE